MMRTQARKDLISFAIATNRKYNVSWHHEDIADKLEKVARGEIKRLMIFVPPRHGKSELASIDLPAWYLGNNPDKEIITASYSADLAQDFGGKTRNLIEDEVYQDIFSLRLRQDERAKAKWLTKEGGSYTSVGIGGAITGRGANLLIIDDPLKNREEADSEVIREKIWSWYKSTAYTRLEKDGAVILILTRWHYDDLAGRLLEAENDGGDKWEVVKYPAIATEDEKHRKEGEALWSWKYNLETLEQIKNVEGLMEWSALYQQNPLISELQEFKQEYFRYFEESDIVDKHMSINILIDPAISKKDEACNTGIIDVAKANNEPFWNVIDDTSGKLDPLQVIEQTFFKVDNYKTEYPMATVNVWIETNAFQEAYMYFFKEEMRKRETYFSINEIKSKQDKHQRIRGLVPMYKSGVIRHRPSMKGGAMEHELLQFPQGKLVDRIDALSFNLQALNPTKYKKRRENRPPNTSLTGY